jgi:DNA-binding response OmpR family regulator
MVQKILVVDDDEDIRKLLKEVLHSIGYDCLEAADGTQALSLTETESPNLLILDISMPGISGFQVLRQLRKTSEIPVIMLSARTDTADKVESLQLGADDYVTKPFKMAEMTARVEAVLRRKGTVNHASEKVDFDDGRLVINFKQRQITVEGKEVELTPKEYELLRLLVLNAGMVLEYQSLICRIWGPEYDEDKKLVQSVVRRLRTKIEAKPKNPEYVSAVEGVGYRFKKLLL